jgi:hypothetical protein
LLSTVGSTVLSPTRRVPDGGGGVLVVGVGDALRLLDVEVGGVGVVLPVGDGALLVEDGALLVGAGVLVVGDGVEPVDAVRS